MNTVDEYIEQFDPQVKGKLNSIRQTIINTIPFALECIKYNMPAFKVGDSFVYFAAYKKHIGFYPVYHLDEIEDELKVYRAKNTKDTLHFKINQPLPLALIQNIVRLKANHGKHSKSE